MAIKEINLEHLAADINAAVLGGQGGPLADLIWDAYRGRDYCERTGALAAGPPWTWDEDPDTADKVIDCTSCNDRMDHDEDHYCHQCYESLTYEFNTAEEERDEFAKQLEAIKEAA